MNAMWLVSLFAIVLSGFARIIIGDSNTNLFIFPTAPGPNENYVADYSWTLGSIQKLQWTTTIDSYSIDLFQQFTGHDFGNQLQTIYDIGGAGQQSLNWQVQTYGSNLSVSPVYFLWLNPGFPQNFTSHYFNISELAQSSSSSSSPTGFTLSTSSTTSTTASSTSSTPPQKSSDNSPTSSAPTSPASTSPISTSPASDNSSTETVRVGFGVGLGIGLPLVLIAGIWIGLKSVRQRKSSSRGTSSDVPLSQFPNNKYPPDSSLPNEAIYYGNQIHEAPGRSDERHEAPGERDLIELGP